MIFLAATILVFKLTKSLNKFHLIGIRSTDLTDVKDISAKTMNNSKHFQSYFKACVEFG